MAGPNDNNTGNGSKEGLVEVPLKTLTEMQAQMAEMERKLADEAAARAGLEELVNSQATAGTDAPKLREKKTFEPKFRTVRLRQYPVAGDVSDQDYVVGWDNRGSYQEVDRSGISPQIVDYINILFLRNSKPKKGEKMQFEKVRLLDLMNRGVQVHCKILEKKEEKRPEPTGEEIDVSIFDPAHGLVSTGEKVDGYVVYSDVEYKVQLPNGEAIWIDGEFVN